ncbi:MAG: hypothetical protein GQ570_03810 [Helicobacteraceae bacterium]|nr:hypothetical protein [Helicobacteraceae bacterium]
MENPHIRAYCERLADTLQAEVEYGVNAKGYWEINGSMIFRVQGLPVVASIGIVGGKFFPVAKVLKALAHVGGNLYLQVTVEESDTYIDVVDAKKLGYTPPEELADYDNCTLQKATQKFKSGIVKKYKQSKNSGEWSQC